jgi:hypothetical protein
MYSGATTAFSWRRGASLPHANARETRNGRDRDHCEIGRAFFGSFLRLHEATLSVPHLYGLPLYFGLSKALTALRNGTIKCPRARTVALIRTLALR